MLSNAIGFDSLKMLNKMEADRVARVENERKIEEELKREKEEIQEELKLKSRE